ncbi:PepSY domain-containing protein [Aquimarina megaterium]|uniref:PepSY domain-containing protein n=1 Tax=Aquimarina megaterium TaxID=1443666 RepID=UPI0009459560|nr:PepSY domain-containing protein [Aquimarina megaterium]
MKQIISLHHWLGTFFCALFLIWFLSGFVMMYQSFPNLSETERIEMLSSSVNTEVLSPKTVFKNDTIDEISQLRLNYVLNRPVFHLITDQGGIFSKYADNGQKVILTKEIALKIAAKNTGITANSTIQILTELDQWIPRTKYLPHMPIFKIEFEDENNTLVYISSVTGELLAINTSSERFWSWVGAIPHWIYFKDIRIHNTLWAQLVTWLAALGFIMVITGIITGLVRYKKKPKAKFKRFKNKWYNYHYYFGLVFGIFVCTWIFSGWMSMTPFGWTPSTQLQKEEVLKWQMQKHTINYYNEDSWSSFLNQLEQKKFKEVSFNFFQNNVYAQVFFQNTSSLYSLYNANPSLSIDSYQKIVNSFSLENEVKESILLKEYDNYYYSRHNDKDLPIIRIKTTKNITYYINPKTTRVVYKCATKNKIQRWIYHGLHSLDFSFLAWNRPLWDIVLFILLTGGTVLSFSATGLGVKFIKRKNRKRVKRKEKKSKK